MDHQIFAQLLGNYGEFVGAIAVVVTLVYLAVQIRQNTNNMQANAYSTWSDSMGSILDMMMSNDRVDQIMREGWNVEDGVTEENWMTFVLWHQRYFYHFESIWQMYKLGTLNKHIFDLEMARVRLFLSTPSVLQWWEAGGKKQISAPLREEIESGRPTEAEFVWILWDKEKGFYSRDDQVEL